MVCVGAGPWANTVLVRNWKAGLRAEGQYTCIKSADNTQLQDSRIRIGSRRGVASGTVRGSSFWRCCRRGGFWSSVVRGSSFRCCCRRGRFPSGAVRGSRGGGGGIRCLGRGRHGLLYGLGDRLSCGITVRLSLSLSLPCLQCSQEPQESSDASSFPFPTPRFYAIAVNPSNLMREAARL